MGFPNPEPEAYKAPWYERMNHKIQKAVGHIQSASENYDPDFPDPSIADLARARFRFAMVIQSIDETLEEMDRVAEISAEYERKAAEELKKKIFGDPQTISATEEDVERCAAILGEPLCIPHRLPIKTCGYCKRTE